MVDNKKVLNRLKIDLKLRPENLSKEVYLEITKEFWYNQFVNAYNTIDYGVINTEENAPTYLVEYSSPNTNKPIHLGHLRNNFLGYSVAEIIKASGKNVKKVQIINMF